MEPPLSLTSGILSGPIVYIAWQDDLCIYVGMSRFGIQRPATNKTLTHYFRTGKLTRLDVYQCADVDEACNFEEAKIKELRPPLNWIHVKGHKTCLTMALPQSYALRGNVDPYPKFNYRTTPINTPLFPPKPKQMASFEKFAKLPRRSSKHTGPSLTMLISSAVEKTS